MVKNITYLLMYIFNFSIDTNFMVYIRATILILELQHIPSITIIITALHLFSNVKRTYFTMRTYVLS
jgi:hypothetical protein